MIANVPAIVRGIAVFLSPVFLAIFVLEQRKRRLYLATGAYFLASSFFLLVGSRSGTLTTILGLWCVSRLKTGKRSRVIAVVLLVGALISAASLVSEWRSNGGTSNNPFTASSFFVMQGTTMGVAETAIEFRNRFSPYAGAYFWNEIKGGFVPQDQSTYTRGQSFADDITVFINSDAYSGGVGLGSSYLAEAYITGGLAGVMLFSFLIGFGIHGLYLSCKSRIGLFAAAALLPSVFWMARAGLFEWVPAAIRDLFLALILYAGWNVYRYLSWILVAQSKALRNGAEISFDSVQLPE
jgi:oligosaccharide repeat unit polymerase